MIASMPHDHLVPSLESHQDRQTRRVRSTYSGGLPPVLFDSLESTTHDKETP